MFCVFTSCRRSSRIDPPSLSFHPDCDQSPRHNHNHLSLCVCVCVWGGTYLWTHWASSHKLGWHIKDAFVHHLPGCLPLSLRSSYCFSLKNMGYIFNDCLYSARSPLPLSLSAQTQSSSPEYFGGIDPHIWTDRRSSIIHNVSLCFFCTFSV